MRLCFVTLNELSVGIEEFAASNASLSIRSKTDALQTKLFEHEVAMRRLWDYSFELLHLAAGDRSPALFREAARAIESLHKRSLSAEQSAREFDRAKDSLTQISSHPSVRDFVSAIGNVKKNLAIQDFTSGDLTSVVQDLEIQELKTTASVAEKETLHINTRQAIQATLGSRKIS
ncbi:MAG: hypothetical protein H7249_01220 [Chitinophagaceae bacterium]|nr:hypothetical protein [Oligoflexus sp.]